MNDGFLKVTFWVLLAICSGLGMALVPTYPATGMIVAFGCFLVMALDVARQFIDQGLTMIDLSYMIWDMKTEERRNRFTGQREFLTKEEADIHDSVFVHEALEEWPEMQKALDKFSRLNPKAYMTLLD